MAMNELYKMFAFGSELKDVRRDHLKKHSLTNIMTISVCAMIAGADDWTDIAGFGQNYHAWFLQFLDMPHGAPSHDTIRRVFSLLEPEAFSISVSQWLQSLKQFQVKVPTSGGQLAIDGKTLKGSFDQAELKQPWLMVGAYATERGLMIGQQGASGEKGELVTIHELLDRLNVKHHLVSIDALGCQKDIAEKIVKKGGDYLLSLKANHPTTEEAVRRRLADQLREDSEEDREDRDHAIDLDKSHGRTMLRRCIVLREVKAIPGMEEWQGVKAAVLMVTEQDRPRRRQSPTQPDRQQTVGYRLYLTSRGASAQEYLQAIRHHWKIENEMHWSLDVTFGEDKSRARKDHGAINLATIRRTGLSLLKADHSKKSIKLKRKLAAWSPNILFQYLGIAMAEPAISSAI